MLKKYTNWGVEMMSKHVVIRYIISGGTSAVVDLTLLYLMNSVLEIHYLLSAILAFLGAFGVSFTLHKFWTFKSHDEKAHKQLVMYLATSLFGLILNTLLMYVFVDHFYIQVILSQIIVGILVACVSFFISRNFVFKYKHI